MVVPAGIADAAQRGDRDRDGMPDRWERRHRLNAHKADGRRDPDRDGLSNLREYRLHTNPRRADTDRDGMPDGWEVRHRLRPRDRRDAAQDPDRDGLSNLREYRGRTDPRRANGTPPPAPLLTAPLEPEPLMAGLPPSAPEDLDAAAQQGLRHALAAAEAAYAGGRAYPAAATLAGDVAGVTPGSVIHAGGPSSGPKDISLTVDDRDTATACARSATLRFYCVRVDRAGRLGAGGKDRVRESSGLTEPDARCVLPMRGAERTCVSATGAAGFTSAPPAAVPQTTARSFVFYSNFPGALGRLGDHGARIGVLAPFWWTLDAARQAITGDAAAPRAAQDAIFAEQQRHGFQLWPCFSANNTAAGNAALDDAAARARMVDVVRSRASALRVPGISIDMEGLTGAQRSGFTTFIGELAAALHADGRKLAVYSGRRTTADDSRVGTSVKAYDWARLASAADLVVVSGYNETAPPTKPGPTTTTAGFQQVVDYAASVSRTKVVPLVAQYGYSWPSAVGGARTLIATNAAEAERTAAGVGGTLADGTMTYTKADGSVVWYETAQGGAARVRQARAAGMAWWGLFSMGREADALWPALP